MIKSSRLCFLLTLVCLLVASSAPAAERQSQLNSNNSSTCTWDDRFYLSGFNGAVSSMTEFDGGAGTHLIAAGDFTAFEKQEIQRVAQWDGVAWRKMGNGFDAAVRSLAVFDDGNGPALYAAGDFERSGRRPVRHVARWDGRVWRSVGAGFDDDIQQLVVHQEGDESWLVVRSTFTTLEGVQVEVLARWDGQAWASLPRPNGAILDLASYDAGQGARLYAAGNFEVPTSDPANPSYHSVMYWDGEAWQLPGDGLRGESIETLAVVDDGTGSALYAAGFIQSAPGDTDGPWKWDGDRWTQLQMPDLTGLPRDFVAFDDGLGTALYALGQFDPELRDLSALLRWDGTSWDVVEGAGQEARTALVWDGGAGSQLLLAGPFGNRPTTDGVVLSGGMISWDGGDFSSAPGSTQEGQGLDDNVITLTAFDDGTGPGVVASGFFTIAGNVEARRVARWDGQSWSPMGRGFDGPAIDLVVFDDGESTQLVAAGLVPLDAAGGTDFIAAWDGEGWQSLGGDTDASVLTLAVHDDGSGPALFAGGRFHVVGGVVASNVARWNGQTWSAVGDGLDGDVLDLVTFDDGTGPALYAAGEFGAEFDFARVLRWDGTSWSKVPMSYPLAGLWGLRVIDNASFSNGTGQSLFAIRGAFALDTSNMLRWTGQVWEPFGELEASTFDMAVLEHNGRKDLFSAGTLALEEDDIGGLARWDGDRWQGGDRYLESFVWVMKALEDSEGEALWLGGDFRSAEGTFSSKIGRYSCQ